MNAIATQFTFEASKMRALEVDGEPWFVASDVAKILGYRDAHAMTRRIDPDDRGTRILSTPGGDQEMTVVSESGLYMGVLNSTVTRAMTFKLWITREVLPSIRKTGSYEAVRQVPQSFGEALRALADEVEAKDLAEARAKELEAPAKAWDVMVSAHGDYAVDEAAKILSRDPEIEIGRNRLFTYMQGIGWIYRQGARRNWHAYQSQVDNGRIILRMTAAFLNAKTGEMENPAPTIRITAKGLDTLLASIKTAQAA